MSVVCLSSGLGGGLFSFSLFVGLYWFVALRWLVVVFGSDGPSVLFVWLGCLLFRVCGCFIVVAFCWDDW
jgi:hypothetical protein